MQSYINTKQKAIICFSPFGKYSLFVLQMQFSSKKKNKFISGQNSNKYWNNQKNSFPQNALTHHKPPPKKFKIKKLLNVKRHRQLQYNIILIGNMFILETYCRLHHSQLIHIQKWSEMFRFSNCFVFVRTIYVVYKF